VVADDTGASTGADLPSATGEDIPAGWHVETFTNRNGVQTRFAVSPDKEAMVALSGVGSGAAGAGTGDTGTGTAPPTTATAGQPTGQASPQFVPYDGPVIPEDAPITDSGTTMGFADEAPVEASSQLSPQDEAGLIALAQHPSSTADDLRHFAAARGHAIANADAVIEARDKGLGVNGSIEYPLPKPADPGTATDAFGRGLLRGPTLDTIDELQGAGAGLNALLHGQGYAQAYDQSVDQTRGQFASDEENHHLASLSGQLVGSLILPTGTEGVAFNAGREALRGGATMAEARVIAAQAVARRLGTVGAAYGGAEGAGGADGGPVQRVLGGIGGATIGMVGGRAFGAAGEAIAPRIQAGRVAARALPAPALTPQQNMLQAAERVGLDKDLMPADTGGPMTRMLTAATFQMPAGAPFLINQAQRLGRKAASFIAEKAASLGSVAGNPEALGSTGAKGARDYISQSAKSIGRWYDHAARLAGDTMVNLATARDVLDEQIARLKAMPQAGTIPAELADLLSLRKQLDSPFPVQAVRDMRTNLRVDPNLRYTPAEGRMKAFIDAASNDVVTSLRRARKAGAAIMYKGADNAWKERLDNIDKAIKPIIGSMKNPASDETVAQRLNAAMKGNSARIAKFVGLLPEDEQKVVRASLLSPLGVDKDGNFSLTRFADNWRDVQDGAKQAIFGPELTAALDDLAKVGRQAKAAARYANFSNTGRAVITGQAISGLATGASALLGVVTLGKVLAAQAGAGLILSSPRVARWFARAPRSSLGAAAYIDRLSRIAVAEPAIANDVLSLQRRLQEAIASVPRQAAADNDRTGKERKPPASKPGLRGQ
jgi:hypothetical protein